MYNQERLTKLRAIRDSRLNIVTLHERIIRRNQSLLLHGAISQEELEASMIELNRCKDNLEQAELAITDEIQKK